MAKKKAKLLCGPKNGIAVREKERESHFNWNLTNHKHLLGQTSSTLYLLCGVTWDVCWCGTVDSDPNSMKNKHRRRINSTRIHKLWGCWRILPFINSTLFALNMAAMFISGAAVSFTETGSNLEQYSVEECAAFWVGCLYIESRWNSTIGH